MRVVTLTFLFSRSFMVLQVPVNHLGLNVIQRIKARFVPHSILIVITQHLLDAISRQ